MIRRAPAKSVATDHWKGRRDNARAFHEAARTQLMLLRPASNANPVISLTASAAMGYADALTAKRIGVVNQEQHDQIVSTLRRAVGNRMTSTIARHLTNIVKEKSTAQYGARHGALETAIKLLASLDAFAQWIEQELGTP